MSTSFSRLGGAVLLIGAVLGIGVNLGLTIIPSDRPTTNPTVIALGWMDILVGLLIILALPTLVSRVALGSRVLTVLGFAGLVMGFLAFSVSLGFERAVDGPYMVMHHTDLSAGPPRGGVLLIGGLAKIVGGVLFGIAAFRSNAVSRVAAVLIIAASAIFASGLIPHIPELVDVVSGVMLLVGFGICGLQLLGVWAPVASGTPTPQSDTRMGAAV